MGNSRFTLLAEAKVVRVRNSDAKKTRSLLGDMGVDLLNSITTLNKIECKRIWDFKNLGGSLGGSCKEREREREREVYDLAREREPKRLDFEREREREQKGYRFCERERCGVGGKMGFKRWGKPWSV